MGVTMTKSKNSAGLQQQPVAASALAAAAEADAAVPAGVAGHGAAAAGPGELNRASLGGTAPEAAADRDKEPANEPLPADFGALLRAAREKAGMSVPTLAMRLRLHVKQIDALERTDLAALPSLIYVRGFLRSCARELGVDPAPLLADLDRRAGVPTGVAPMLTAGSFGLSRFGDGSRPIIALGLAALVLAGLVGIWMPRHANTVAVAPSPPVAAPADEAAVADRAAQASAPAEAAKPAGPASAAAGPAPRAPLKAPGPLARIAAPPAPPAPEPAPPVEPVAVAAPPPPAPDGLVLHVRATSWVEVVQANGVPVFSQLCLPGSEHAIQGVAPLRVVIGNAAMVDAQYHGATVDLLPHANANGVARFTIQ